MIKNLVECIFITVLITIIPSLIMLLSGSTGPFLLDVSLLFLSYILLYFVKED